MEAETINFQSHSQDKVIRGNSRKKTRRGKKKSAVRERSLSRQTTRTPFAEIKFSHILHSSVKRTPFPPSHPLYVGLAADAQTKRIKEFISQILEVRLCDTRQAPSLTPCSVGCRRRLEALLAEVLARRRRCRPSALLARRCGRGRVPPGALASALGRLLRRLLPADLLGPRRLDAAIRHLLSLGRYDLLSVGDITRGLRLQGRAWLAGERADAAVPILNQVAVWAFRCFVLDVLGAYFYVTELLQPRLQLGFFLLRHWQRLTDGEVARLTAGGALQPLPPVGPGAARRAAARLRFLPKSSGALRPVCSLQRSVAVKDRWAQLRTVLRLPQMGRDITASDRRQLHLRWMRFVTARRRLPSPLWYVRADVRDAYGSVSHELLLRVLHERLAAMPAQVYLARRSRGTGYMAWDGGSALKISVSTAAVLEEVTTLVNTQEVRYGRRRFRLARGLLQGGPLSADLCDLYYDSVLRRAVPWCFPERSQEALLMFRCVDDLLLISERRSDALRFLERLQAGLDGRHARLNGAKTRTNLHGEHGPEVTFFGTVFSVDKLEVSPDFSAYRGVDMRFTFRTRQLRSPGRYLMARLPYLATVRLSPIHWDPRINSAGRLRRSLDAHLALTGRRYVALLSRLGLDRDQRNAAFLARAAALCWRRVTAALRQFARRGGYRPWAQRWLVRRAGATMFLRVLPPHLEQLRAVIGTQAIFF
ncbi:telomerase reverse transcriptase-like isoform X2 [Amphibalanus amphitrite]|uniref:telomerase reverse transcriptase-like isoform X2 n=1 Tax=Amphibalanus amphitrite TaxID=1232801 RepID=UPI001C91AEE4|nr:telomerase reverse transcriptase-like isoform X2 [Amphibalanus amphitrite]